MQTYKASIRQAFEQPWELLLPDAGTDIRAVVIALHGYGQRPDDIKPILLEGLENDIALVFLQGPFPHHRKQPQAGAKTEYGFGWITSYNPQEAVALHHNAILQILDELKQHAPGVPRLLFGFSQSVALNFRFVFTHPQKCDGVIAICGGIPGDWDSNPVYRAAQKEVLYTGVQEDRVYPPAVIRNNAQKLAQRRANVETLFFTGKHRIPRDAFKAMNDFISRPSR